MSARPTRSGVGGRLLNAPGNFVFAVWDFGSKVDKALHADELHPVQGQGAGRFRAGNVPHNEDFRVRKVDPQPRLACRDGDGVGSISCQ